MSKTPKGSYPRQPQQFAVYPQQQQYPGAYAPPQQQGTYYGAPFGMYSVPPPPYTERPQHTSTSSASLYPASTSGSNNPGVAAQHYAQSPTVVHQGPYPQQYPGQVVPSQFVQGSFDPGARFGIGATANIPPPPPGFAPTAAQMASAQGQNVVMHQRQAGWFSGGTDGGYTVW